MRYPLPLSIALLLLAATPLLAQSVQWYRVEPLPWGNATVHALEADSLDALYALVASGSMRIAGSDVATAALWRSSDRGGTWERLRDSVSPYAGLIVDGGNGVTFTLPSEHFLGPPDDFELQYHTFRHSRSGTTRWLGRSLGGSAWNKEGGIAAISEYTEYVDSHISLITTLVDDTAVSSTIFDDDYRFSQLRGVTVMEGGTVLVGFEGVQRASGLYSGRLGGTTWRHLDSTFIPTVLYTTDANALLASNDSAILRSTDSGATWRVVDSTPGVRGFTVDARGTLYTLGGHTLRSTTQGESWERVAPAGPRIWTPHTDTLFTLLDGRPALSTDRGTTWQRVDAGLPDSTTTGLAVAADGSVYATGKGGVGLYRLERRTLGAALMKTLYEMMLR